MGKYKKVKSQLPIAELGLTNGALHSNGVNVLLISDLDLNVNVTVNEELQVEKVL
jgi:hypothetical protein